MLKQLQKRSTDAGRLRRRWLLGGVASLAGIALLSGCTGAAPNSTATGTATPSDEPRPTASAPASAARVPPVPVQPSGDPVTVTSGLDAPWSILRLTADGVGLVSDAQTAAPTVSSADGTSIADGTTLLSERDSGDILELLADGSTRVVATVSGVSHGGEGGLLGLAARAVSAAALPTLGDPSGEPLRPTPTHGVQPPSPKKGTSGTDGSGTASPAARQPAASGTWIYAYFTSDSDNRVVRMPLQGAAGALTLGQPELVLSGIPRAGNHNGGRIAFGPDGLLYATAGDAGNGANAQNPDSLGGKILRMTPTGGVPSGNPFGTLVWSLGHRNPQGIGWDSTGRMLASEFGQNTWDELNLITPGSNYGWPAVEGVAGAAGFVDPVAQWATSEASPSGLAVVNDTVFIASLRGERIWRWVPDAGAPPSAWFEGEFGRIRDVAAGADGTLWFVSNNTDGRGDPGEGDDRLWQVALVPATG